MDYRLVGTRSAQEALSSTGVLADGRTADGGPFSGLPGRAPLLRWLLLMLSLPGAFAAAGTWELDTERSSVGFVSIKAGSVGEQHWFRELSGSISSDGEVALQIDPLSVDTKVEIRDQRLRDLFFQAAEFPRIEVGATVPLAELEALLPGDAKRQTVAGTLSLVGSAQPLLADLHTVRLSEREVLVSSAAPVLVSADAFGLAGAVEQLRELAGLPSISTVVPVTLNLYFQRPTPVPVVVVEEARVRQPLPGTTRTAGYVRFHNPGKEAVQVVAVSSPLAARVEIHETVQTGEQVRMQRVEALEIAAGGTAELKPGGMHLMLFEAQAPMPERVEVMFEFATGATQTVGFRSFGVGDE